MIVAFDGFNQSPPNVPTPVPYIITVVMIWQYDTTCPPEEGCSVTMDASGFTEAPVFQFSRDLSSAVLKTTVMMTDTVSGRSFPLAVDLSWIGIGETRHHAGTFMIREPGIIFKTTGNNYFRWAEVSGSVIDLDTDFDFASQTTMSAFLERASGNEIRVEFGR